MKDYTIKKIIAVFLAFFIIVSFAGCKKTDDGQIEEENQSETVENSIAYPNYAGYPIEEGDICFHRMFINGEEYFLDAYTHNDNPDVLFFSPTPIIYDWNGNAVGCSSKGKCCFAFCVEDTIALMAIGDDNINFNGELFKDVAPENYQSKQYGDIFYCSTFFFVRMLGASVNFSDDRSAVYLNTERTADSQTTNKYDLHVTAEGELTAHNTADNTVIKFDMKGNYSVSEKKVIIEDNGQDAKIKIPCSRCGGSGRVGTVVKVCDPVTGVYHMEQTYQPCLNCGGKGYTTIYK